MQKDVAVRIIVSGRVQGVFFRANTRQKAESLGLSGWVRNLSDGGVEAFAEGPVPDVAKLIKYMRQSPAASIVSDLKLEDSPPQGLKGFVIK